MEPVTGVERISKQRWKLRCSICEIREGACIQCAKTSCFLAFHPTCARKEKLLLPMKSTQGTEPLTLTCYCERHLPKEQQEAREKALAAEDEDEALDHLSKSSKSARAYAKSYKPGPPLIPAIIVNRISQYIAKINFRKKPDFLYMMCRYWSLKREARRGAPLLKRLHLEPWTANNGAQLQSEEERAKKLSLLRGLEENLDKAKALVELTRKREVKKRQQAELIQNILTSSLFPHESKLRFAFENIIQMDRHDYFKNPVNKAQVPDYFEVVKQPMCWTVIDGKLDKHQYWDLDEFKHDIQLVLDNAILYNKSGTPYHKTATRIRAALPTHFQELDQLTLAHPQPDTNLPNEVASEFVPWASPSSYAIGDLEPPMDVIELLVSSEAFANDLSIILNDDPITSLFNFELPVDKPPPPPPPPPPPKPRKGKHKQTRAEKDAYNAKRREQRAAMKATAETGGLSDGAVISTPSAFTEDGDVGSTASEMSANDALSFGSVSAGPSQLSKSRRPPTISLPSQPELLDSVDNKGSFRFFNAGWILPPDQKRGGRGTATERPPLPPPRKKAKTGPGADERAASSLSVFSTAEAENETLRESPGDGESSAHDPPFPQHESADASTADQELEDQAEKSEQQAIEDEVQPPPESANVSIEHEAMEIDVPSVPPPVEDPPTDPESGLPPRTITRLANGTTIIEELDTPAIRRLKNMKRKEERGKLQQAITSGAQAPVAGSLQEQTKLESELSSLNEIGSEGNLKDSHMQDLPGDTAQKPKGKGKGKGKARQPMSANAPEPGLIQLDDGKLLPGGTLVWAKSGSYPWWPAVIWEADDPTVPVNIVELCKKEQKKRKGKTIHIIQFFDKTSSWQCLTLDKLRMLGEDQALDEDLIAANSRRQRWRSANARAECRDAYRQVRSKHGIYPFVLMVKFRKAKSEMETDGDEGDGGEGDEVGVETEPQGEGTNGMERDHGDEGGGEDGEALTKDVSGGQDQGEIDEGESEVDDE
ncbi:hypothetical protein PM082_007735 [Marasmius tenuissimus]|nr:hypothetical protein PM082_007735 [Marasmius tenuissimus]